MILTAKYVIFGRLKSEDVIDIIPQHEISSITSESATETIVQEEGDVIDKDNTIGAARQFFYIQTIPDGYNSGRQYKIRANSSQNLKAIIQTLSTLSRAASEKAAAKSKFRKTQDKVARLFNNNWTQRILAMIIFGASFFHELEPLSTLRRLSNFFLTRTSS